MRIRQDPSGRQLVLTSTGGFTQALAGMMFAGFGTLFLLLVLRAGSEQMALPVLVPFTSMFILIGVILIGARRAIIIDRQHDEIRSWWGVFVPWRRQILGAVQACTKVSVQREVRRSGSGSDRKTYLVYVVRLHAEEEQTISISAPK